MRYYSTRGSADPVSFADAVLRGLAPDGGLYVPERIVPAPSNWRDAPTYSDLAIRFLAPYTGHSVDELTHLVGDTFDIDIPLVQTSPNRYVLELFHGPTLAFKDFAGRFLGKILDAVLQERNETRLVVVATSGDTGSAVASGFAGSENVRIVLLYPKGKVSDVQEQQIITPRDGVLPIAVEGSFDDCQRLVKEALMSDGIAGEAIGAANSINIARLLPQATYYAYAAQQLLARGIEPSKVTVVVPSGNLGNLSAGLIAKQAGIPLGPFIAAHNGNSFFPAVLAGDDMGDTAPSTIQTKSNAMDVGYPSNYERLVHWFSKGFEPPQAVSMSDGDMLAAMKREYDATEYVACPHTSVGFAAADRLIPSEQHMVLATAHPSKFPATIIEVLGTWPQSESRMDNLPVPDSVETIQPRYSALEDAITLWFNS